MGPISQVLEMVPGFSAMKGKVSMDELDGSHLVRTEAIIRSMTAEERRRPDIIGGSRRRRIARGSGTTPQDVNQLLNQFSQMQKMMRQMMGVSTGKQGKGGKRQSKKMRRMMRQQENIFNSAECVGTAMFKMPFSLPRASIYGTGVRLSGVGVFITGISVRGRPLLVLFFLSQGWGRQHSRIDGAVLIFMGTAVIVSYGLNDLYTPARSTLLIASIVPATLAALLGDRIAKSLTRCRVAARRRRTGAGIQRVCPCDEGGQCGVRVAN
ncbi:Signal recognition particle protein [Geodia barretti]|uniref:Signal recognition particle protein n=1 Tax=Geodia barretti TaxID=519541 RepID=A0AA35U0C3_GEOBA|nr:Signal recognition particle protein [Geodia barretti]